jgi:hypothetical protein
LRQRSLGVVMDGSTGIILCLFLLIAPSIVLLVWR